MFFLEWECTDRDWAIEKCALYIGGSSNIMHIPEN